jgi:alkaline phosphatase
MKYIKLSISRIIIPIIMICTAVLIVCASGDGEKQVPKNIIFMIGDGCGFNHIDAANLYEYGRTGIQIYEQFPVRYAMSTYSASGHGYDPDSAWATFDYVKHKYTDSASAATAMSTGVKTKDKIIGLDIHGKPLIHIIEHLDSLGKATGVVTSERFSHATPAAFVAHNIHRDHYAAIAREMILESRLEVIMGSGHPAYDSNGTLLDSSYFYYKYVGGDSIWQALEQGHVGNDADGDSNPDYWTLIEDRSEFKKLASGQTPKRIIGIPKVRSKFQQSRKGNRFADPFVVPLIETVPTLSEMTLAALNVLDDDPDGFFLMVEGAAIDGASHDNHSGRMIEEMIDFNHAIQAVVSWVETHSSWRETLVIVTADHECGYLTGPGSGVNAQDQPVWNPLVNHGKGNLPGMEWHSGDHTNSLAPFFAKGAGSHRFHSCADEIDPVRGKYLDNAEIGQVLFSFFE